MFQYLTPALSWALTIVYILLVLASLIIWLLPRLKSGFDNGELVARIKSWWVMTLLYSVAMILGPTGALFFLGFVSFLALKEYLSLIPTRRTDRLVLFWAYLCIPAQFWFIHEHWYGMFIIWVPVYVFIILSIRTVLTGEAKGFLRAIGSVHWGLMITVYSLGHAAYLLVLPPEVNPVGGAAGLLFFLVFLTEFNDVAQYVWGRLFGSARVVPSISPNKTWAGLAGGVLTITAIGWLIAPWLTPLEGWQRLAAGFYIGVVGFFGDITLSAVKRDLGIKDSGGLIPGHGGVLDRVDSLVFTAPLFFHFVYYFYY